MATVLLNPPRSLSIRAGWGPNGGNSGGGMNTKKSDDDPEVGKRQTAANVLRLSSGSARRVWAS